MPVILDLHSINFRLIVWEIKEQESYFQSLFNQYKDILSFKSTQKRLQKFAARYVLGLYYPEIKLKNSKKPIDISNKYHVSIAHSNKLVVILVSSMDVKMAIDTECFAEQKSTGLERMFLSESELRYFYLNFTKLNFYKFWCSKEAIYKIVSENNNLVSFKREINVNIEDGFGIFKRNSKKIKFNLEFIYIYDYLIAISRLNQDVENYSNLLL